MYYWEKHEETSYYLSAFQVGDSEQQHNCCGHRKGVVHKLAAVWTKRALVVISKDGIRAWYLSVCAQTQSTHSMNGGTHCQPHLPFRLTLKAILSSLRPSVSLPARILLSSANWEAGMLPSTTAASAGGAVEEVSIK